METIINLYNAGGWSLLLFGLLVLALAYAVKAVVRQFKEMNTKIDDLTTKVSDLRCDVSSYMTAIRTCTEPNCPNKQLLQKS